MYEPGTISTIQEVFEAIPMKWEFKIVSYRIKSCLLEHVFPTVSDEYDHKGKYINYEISEIKFIKDNLNFNFTSYNIDAKISKPGLIIDGLIIDERDMFIQTFAVFQTTKVIVLFLALQFCINHYLLWPLTKTVNT